MADGHGGYRKPSKPAPVSGPGAHARRTDGGPAQSVSSAPGQAYGERKNQEDAQHIAPMAGKDPMPKPAAEMPSAQPSSMPPYGGGDFAGPSSRPDEPVTAGAAAGPGPGPEILGMQPAAMPTGYITQLLQRMSATDTTGTLAKLYEIAQQRGV